MRCSNCGTDNREGAKFCDECGAALAGRVPVKAADIASANVPPTRGERRHLTVLFCDLVDSTTLAARLDPEEWREVVAAYHHATAEAITRFGGHVAHYFGDGVMAYFGWPEAHDNNAERAARAGLAILDAISKLNEHPTRSKLSARVGIDSGAVVVGASAGKDADVFGETPNIAARVQAAAAPGTVLITADTHKLLSGLFIVEDRGAQVAKGIERPLQLYRVVQPSGVRSRLEAATAAHGLTSFIGRDGELRLLMSEWKRSLEGEGHIVLISGEAGIGKSRLVQCFHEQIAGRRFNWVEAAAGPFFQNTPFYPVAEILRQLPAQRDSQPGRLNVATVHQRKGILGRSNGHTVNAAPTKTVVRHGKSAALRELNENLEFTPQLATALFNLLGSMEHPLSPHQRRLLLSSLVDWVLGAAHVLPLVIAIEDLHWADPSTLELVELLLEQARSAPLLLLCTARPEFRASWQLMTKITLPPLSAHHTRLMLEQVAGQNTLPEELATTVVERTGGVPLFVEELARAVLESGPVRPSAREIPVTLHDSLMARLDRLGLAKEVLQIGAVIGTDFSYELLHAVHPIDEQDLREALQRAADAELVYLHGIAPDATYQFRHALIRDAAYEALLKSKRRDLHTRIAQTVEERFADHAAAQPEILAYHYTEAGVVERAVGCWRRAGRKAIERSANIEAIAHLRKGLELIKALPATPERLMEEVKLQISLITPLIATVGYTAPEVEKASGRALELCQQLGETPQLFGALGSLQVIYFNRGQFEIALELATEMLRLAETQQDSALLLWAHYALGLNFAWHGDLKRSRVHLERSLSLYEPRRGGAYGFVQDPGPTGLAVLANVVHSLGYPEQALGRMRLAVAQARDLSHPYTLAGVLGSAGWLHWERREKLPAQDFWNEQAALCAKHGFNALLASASLRLGFADVESGKAEDGLRKMLDAVASCLTADKLHSLGWLALAEGKAGRIDQGLTRIDEALMQTKKRHGYWLTFLFNLIKGQLVLMKNPNALRTAKQCFSVAIESARNQNAKSDELTAAIQITRVLVQQGRRDQARSILKKIYNWFTEGFDTADLKQAKALLDELSC